LFDHADPNLTTLAGDTPGPLGGGDHGDPTLPLVPVGATTGGSVVRTVAGPALATGAPNPTAQPVDPNLWKAWAPPADFADLYAMLSDPVAGEGNISHMYLDSKDKVTVGIGAYLPNVEAAKKLRFYNRETGKVATDEEKETDYKAVAAAKPDRKKNPGGYRAAYYKQHTKLDMTPTDIGERWLADVKTFQKQLPHYFSGFDGYPAAAKQALTDIAYQYGAKGASQVKDGKLKQAVEAADWKTAATLSETLEGQAKRKEKRKAQFQSLVKP
jgi:GH24 family phage-related lysozyme (muramidase)